MERDCAIRERDEYRSLYEGAHRNYARAQEERDEARDRAQALSMSLAWMKSPTEACLQERADGTGGCGACSLCCKEMRERAERAEALLLAREKHNGQ
jgi:hypothetical protein